MKLENCPPCHLDIITIGEWVSEKGLMTDKQAVDVETVLDAMVHAAHPPASQDFALLAEAVAKLFAAAPDEVAILAVSVKGKSLKFVIPEELSVVGTIPLSSMSALAARTVRERRTEMANNFNSSRHASVFEGVPLAKRQGQTIYKIMSAPILDGKKAIGVVQISRKGQSASESGPDFTSKDLQTLTALCSMLEKFLKLCAVQ